MEARLVQSGTLPSAGLAVPQVCAEQCRHRDRRLSAPGGRGRDVQQPDTPRRAGRSASSSRDTALDLRDMDSPPRPHSSGRPGWPRAGQGHEGGAAAAVASAAETRGLPLASPLLFQTNSGSPAAISHRAARSPSNPGCPSFHKQAEAPPRKREGRRVHTLRLALRPGRRARSTDAPLWREERRIRTGAPFRCQPRPSSAGLPAAVSLGDASRTSQDSTTGRNRMLTHFLERSLHYGELPTASAAHL